MSHPFVKSHRRHRRNKGRKNIPRGYEDIEDEYRDDEEQEKLGEHIKYLRRRKKE